jgi:gluconate 5-dehydrogenase
MTSALSLFNLSGRRALITGSSRGIGYALAEAFAEAGAAVVLNAREAASLAAPLAALRGRGFSAEGAAFDVTDHAAIRAAIDSIESGIGPIDILVNNAGIQIRGAAVDYDPADWRRLQATNLDSVFFVS